MTIEQSLVMPTPKPTTIPNDISLYLLRKKNAQVDTK